MLSYGRLAALKPPALAGRLSEVLSSRKIHLVNKRFDSNSNYGYSCLLDASKSSMRCTWPKARTTSPCGTRQRKMKLHIHAASEASVQTTESAEPSTGGDLVFYNTMSRKKEVFVPREGEPVGLYVCGVTVYDYSHIGHARAYVAFDVLYRTLLKRGYDVIYCRNFTDVDDKIITRAAEAGVPPLELTERFIEEFKADVKALGCLPPKVEPKVTENIENIITMIGTIIDNGHAYPVDGDVYFNVPSLEGYGKLSGRKMDDNRAGERVSVDDRKKNSADFALWKGAKEGEISWDSPWGPGRPGWHIECSAMSASVLGKVIDIHGGGADLVFPHHENELAQSRAACSHSHVRYWMHNGFVTIDEEKMSKSLGNFFTIREVIEKYHPTALRWLLLNTQYRMPINYSQRGLEESSERVFYIYQAVCDLGVALAAAEDDQMDQASQALAEAGDLEAAMEKAMSDDLNTPAATAALYGAIKTANDLLHTKAGRKTKNRPAKLYSLLGALRDALESLGLPVGAQDPSEMSAGFASEENKEWIAQISGAAQQVLDELKQKALDRVGLTEADIQERIEARKAARADKDYETADKVRIELEEQGIAMMDTPQGTTWKPVPKFDK